MAPKIPPEIYDLLIEAIGSGLSSDQYMERREALRDLQACTNTSRLLWHLGRRQLFHEVCTEGIINTRESLKKYLTDLLVLMSDEIYPITPLIMSFRLHLSEQAVESIYSEAKMALDQTHLSTLLVQILILLGNQGTLLSLRIERRPRGPLRWSAIHTSLGTSIHTLLRLTSLTHLGLVWIHQIPPGLLLGSYVRSLKMQFCGIDSAEKPLAQHEQQLTYPPLTSLENFGGPFMAILLGDKAQSGGHALGQTYIPLKRLIFAIKYLTNHSDAAREVTQALDLSLNTLEKLHLQFSCKYIS